MLYYAIQAAAERIVAQHNEPHTEAVSPTHEV